MPPPVPTIFVSSVLLTVAATIFAQYRRYRRRVHLIAQLRADEKAKVIQAHSRRMLAIRHAEQQKLKARMELEWDKALRLQKAGLLFLYRLREKRQDGQFAQAALTIQSAYRGYVFRRYVREMRNAAAVPIQSAVRGWVARAYAAMRLARFRWINLAAEVKCAHLHKERMAILWRAMVDAILEARDHSESLGVWGSLSDGISTIIRPVVSWGETSLGLPPQPAVPKHVALVLLRLPLVRVHIQKASKLSISPALIRTINRADAVHARVQAQNVSPLHRSRRALTMPPAEIGAWLEAHGQSARCTQRETVDGSHRRAPPRSSVAQRSQSAQSGSTPSMRRAATLKPHTASSSKCQAPPSKQTLTSARVHPVPSKQSMPMASAHHRTGTAPRGVTDRPAKGSAVHSPPSQSRDHSALHLAPSRLPPPGLSAAADQYQQALIEEMTSPPPGSSGLPPNVRIRGGETPDFAQSRIHAVPSPDEIRIRGAATPPTTRTNQENAEGGVPHMREAPRLRARVQGETVYYLRSDGILSLAQVLAVHHDGNRPYYTIFYDGHEGQVYGEWLMDLDSRYQHLLRPSVPPLVSNSGSGPFPGENSALSARSRSRLQGSFHLSTGGAPRILSARHSSRRHLISDAPLSESTKDMPVSARRHSTSSTHSCERVQDHHPIDHAGIPMSCECASTPLEQLELYSTPRHQEMAPQEAWTRGTYGLATSPFRSPSLHAPTPQGIALSMRLPRLNIPESCCGTSSHQSFPAVATAEAGMALGVPEQVSVRMGSFHSSSHSSCRSRCAGVPFPLPSASARELSARSAMSSHRNIVQSCAPTAADRTLRDTSSSARLPHPRRPASLADPSDHVVHI